MNNSHQEYTCPMHPEIRAQSRGACPKCAMALEASVAAPVIKTDYVCPMHPQIVSSSTGSCPICGMALEPRVVSLNEEPDSELVELTRRFWICFVLSLPIFLPSMPELIAGEPVPHPHPCNRPRRRQLVLPT